MREVLDIPTEVLLALETDGCQRIAMEDGEVAKVGRWLVLREFADDANGFPMVVSSRAFVFADDREADETMYTMLEECIEAQGADGP